MDVPAPENFLQQLFDNHRYADLIISATHYLGEHDFFVHKVVVALRCPRFESIHRLQIAEGKVELEEHRGVVEKVHWPIESQSAPEDIVYTLTPCVCHS
jgi:hypothetical protein